MSLSRLTGLTLSVALASAIPAAAQETTAETQPTEAAEANTAGAECGADIAPWIRESNVESNISQVEGPLGTMISTGATGRLVGFHVSEDGQFVRLEAESVGSGDPVLTLLDGSGSVLAENDDAGDTLSSRIETTLAAGDYCLRVTNYDSNSVQMGIQIGHQDDPPLFEVSSTSTGGGSSSMACTADTEARQLTEGALDAAVAAGDVALSVPANGVNYLRFELAEPTELTLRAASPSLDPTATLFDAQGNIVAQNDDADGTNSRMDFPSALPAGIYCMGVSTYDGGTQEGEIRVSASKLDLESYLAGSYRRGELVPPLGGSFPVRELNLAEVKQEVALLGGQAQWYSFEVATPTVVIVEAFGSLLGVDPKLALFSGNGQAVADNDDYNNSNDARLGPVLLAPGRYSMALTDVNQTDQPGAAVRPVMLSFERFLRAE
ncbi:DVUA0089 family protein [Paracoccus sulfuroxidans]|uniref:Pre-peptidase n=1 Tax=Paracoccus sulfuroxidans TaxID=384678 RepID=A0A562NAY4_9RHOB|nr:DVUA0089 family protein [Paracoccus sulfuroxidans]TWI29253.1 hypothetical protein IQ24_03733 [Paracoccus sulfuroxidans]